MEWHIKRKGEFFYRRAKAEKYRARSAYKLLDLQKKFHIIKSGNIVVDLGAAPGSWSQVALKFVGMNGKVIGVDIKKVLGLDERFEFVLGDIIRPSTLEKLKQKLPRPADVVLSDVSPEFSGIRLRDIGLAMQFSFKSLEIVKDILKPGGIFVSKAFRGADYDTFINEVRKNFAAVKEVKPSASLKESAEIYILGLKFKKERRPSGKTV
ncbi:MAG TPA: RlmE family RNA methyltransferase [Candidatus Nanoarchaeia archaeon]|nr:RlmE family RNA methyltransferase [Candidatus Nanoarchaeia archaeon]